MGAVIGYERELKGKPAGLRTYTLVSLGAAFFTLIPLQFQPPPGADGDPLSRVIQGIAAGVGFLGAGEIWRESQQNHPDRIRGLTSAAAIWVSASLGVAAGCGLWQLSLLGSILTFLVLRFFKRLEPRN